METSSNIAQTRKKTGLLKLTGLYMAGNFTSKVFSFLLVFALTYYLSKSEIGTYDLIITSISLVIPMISLQIDSALMRWMLDDKSDYSNDTLLQNTFALLVFNVSIATIIYFAATFFYEFQFSALVYLLAVMQVFLPTLQQSLRGQGLNKLYATIGVINSLLYVTLSAVALVFFDSGLKGVLIANITANSIIVIYIIIKLKYYLYFKFRTINIPLLKTLINYSLPLLPNSISWWLVGSSTRYVILLYLGIDANGIFAISYKYPTIILMITSVFNLAWQESSISENNSNNYNKTATETLLKYTNLLFSTIIMLSVTSKFFIVNFINEKFSESWKYMPILLFAVGLQALSAFYGVGYLKSRKTKGAFVSSAIGALITIGSSFLLTRKLGLYGTSISILLGYGCMLIIRVYQSKNLFHITFPLLQFTKLSLVLCICTACIYLDNVYTAIISILVAIATFIVVNFSLILQFKQKIIVWKTKN